MRRTIWVAFLALGALVIGLCFCSFLAGVWILNKPIATQPTISSQLPKFTVVGHDKTFLSLLVSKDTSDEQLATLIYGLRQTRNDNTLGQIGLPPTTPNGTYGDFALITLYIFTEPEWASESNLKKSTQTSPDDPFYAEYNRHIKAYYSFQKGSTQIGRGDIEEGSIGYQEDGKVYSTNYRKLF